MTKSSTGPSVSRRAALAGLGAGGLGLALSVPGRRAAAQGGAGDPAGHPLVGTWAVMTTGGVIPQIHGADGSIIAAFPPNYVDAQLGLTFQGPGLGRWEATGERTAQFTFFQALSDANGAYIGTFQLVDTLTASEDGQTWSGSTDQARIVMRDAANNVIVDQVVPFDPPVTATRIGASVESVVLPVATPAVATPAA
jgi:hypothetical protein